MEQISQAEFNGTLLLRIAMFWQQRGRQAYVNGILRVDPLIDIMPAGRRELYRSVKGAK